MTEYTVPLRPTGIESAANFGRWLGEVAGQAVDMTQYRSPVTGARWPLGTVSTKPLDDFIFLTTTTTFTLTDGNNDSTAILGYYSGWSVVAGGSGWRIDGPAIFLPPASGTVLRHQMNGPRGAFIATLGIVPTPADFGTSVFFVVTTDITGASDFLGVSLELNGLESSIGANGVFTGFLDVTDSSLPNLFSDKTVLDSRAFEVRGTGDGGTGGGDVGFDDSANLHADRGIAFGVAPEQGNDPCLFGVGPHGEPSYILIWIAE